jgi:protocatechuate 3,4-dioxygenase beta subunit
VPDDAVLSRRKALALLGAVGLGAAAACTGSSSGTRAGTRSASTSPASTASSGAPGCVLTPEATEGPYYLDLNRVRSDITDGRPGTPLDLAITVMDARSCTPISGAAVDIWHCDAGGVYSGFGAASPGRGAASKTDDQVFLRGTQLTTNAGASRFHTIYPGWYPGRAVHIHVKVHAGGSVVHTGQLYFDDALTNSVYKVAPYSAHGTPDTRNSSDSIFRDSGAAASVVKTDVAASGYAAAITLGVRTS